MLCATVKEDSLQEIELANKKADLIELRLDLFTPQNLSALRAACKKPVIFKLNRFEPGILKFAPDMIDLPFGVDIDLPLPRICSYHNEEETPDLEALYGKMQASCKAAYYKIATHARSSLDALRMLQFVRKTKAVGLCMGDLGMVTRILAPIFGAPWTYAPLHESQKTAPGQLLLDELVHTYRYRTLSERTALYGLIGDPVSKSVSHKTHNFAFDELGLDAVYVKMLVKKEELSTFLPTCQSAGFKGLSVTMPLKESIREGEAINTLAFCDGGISYWNTDGSGALDALEKRTAVAGKKIVILGAGGSAVAIAKEAEKRGAEVWIANRTPSRALKISTQVLSLEEFASNRYDILINCTPVCPIATEALLENRVVMDIITRPKMTSLLKAAEEKGCTLVYGLDMFIQQAVGQYCHWFLNEKLESYSV
ncbi:MAG: type I 3-dehydroquinate dehydratase [Chlamydiales bacterium]|nr:type I 3-dehydroquinate dehydratase [Chlamydiales bacterium]